MMTGEYHKIKNIFNREPKGERKLIRWDYSCIEFDMLRDIEWRFTEKIDGMNIRIIWENNRLSIKGRTDRAQIPDGVMKYFKENFKEEDFMEEFGDKTVCFYGEGCGDKIQKGGGNYTQNFGGGNIIVLFDVKIDGLFLDHKDWGLIPFILELFTAQEMITGTATLDEGVYIASKGVKSFFGDFQAEGLIGRPLHEIRDRRGNRIILKIKTKDFYKGKSQK